MSDVRDKDVHRLKRFKHQSYNEQLKQIHAPVTLARSEFDEALDDEECLFHGALQHWMQLNLSSGFISFAHRVAPLSQSLPLLLHSWEEVLDLWFEHAAKSDDEALKAMFDVLQRLIEDLRLTLSPAYDSIMSQLLSFLPRRILPESLRNLLSALMTVFKQLLVPILNDAQVDSESSVLYGTWMNLSTTLEKCNSEIQRAVAEVWSSVIRRLKRDDQHKCIKIMIASGENVEDVVAWSMVYASLSIAQTLHICTSSLITSCLDYHIEADVAKFPNTEKLLRRILTAAIHHCAKAEQFSTVTDELIQRFRLMTDGSWPVGSMKRLLSILGIPCSVRQGSRLSSNQISLVLDSCTQLTYNIAYRSPLLTLITAALCSSSADLGIWISPGRRAIDYVWSVDSDLAIVLTGALHELEWGGFAQIALPPFTKHLQALFISNSSRDIQGSFPATVIHVLSELARKGAMKRINGVWRMHLASVVSTWLDNFVVNEGSVIALRDVTALIPLLSSYEVIPSFVSLAEKLAASQVDAASESNVTWANETWVFGHIVRSLADERYQGSLSTAIRLNLVSTAVRKWSWSEYVMEGIAAFAKIFSTSAEVDLSSKYDSTRELLITNSKSHSHIIRRSSLELLSLPNLRSDISEELLSHCLAAEVVPLSVQGMRERIVQSGRVGRSLLSGDWNDVSVQLCVIWLIGQLKVNIKPLWKPSHETLSEVCDRYGEIVWRELFFELNAFEPKSQVSPDRQWLEFSDKECHGIQESERTWRDSSTHRLWVTIASWRDGLSRKGRIVDDQKVHDRLNQSTYETQLLAALEGVPSLAEKHNRELVPLFLNLALMFDSERTSRNRLIHWMNLFSKFVNPKALYRSVSLQDFYIKCLAHPDRAMQRTALSCILSYKSPALARHAESLKCLLDNTKWRDELTNLEIPTLTMDERGELIPVLIRMAYGMMRERGASYKRSAFLTKLASCTEDELGLFVNLMIEPFINQSSNHDGGSAASHWNIEHSVGLEKQEIGFLMLLGDVLMNLGTLIVGSLARLFSLTIALVARAQQRLQPTEDKNLASEDENVDVMVDAEMEVDAKLDKIDTKVDRQLRIIRQLGLKRLAHFFGLPLDLDFAPFMEPIFQKVISPRLMLLDRENTQAPSALLNFLDVLSSRADTAKFLVLYDSRTLTKVFDCLVARNVKVSVVTCIFDMIDRLLDFSAHDKDLSDTVIRPYVTGLLQNLATLVQRSSENKVSGLDSLAQRQLSLLPKLSPYIKEELQASTLLSLFLPQLGKSEKIVPEKSKIDILKTSHALIPLVADLANPKTVLFVKTYETISQLFQFLRGRNARLAVLKAFDALVLLNSDLKVVAELLASFNAYSLTRVDAVDFDRRLSAFAKLNEELWYQLSARDWMPLLHNMLYNIQDEEELSIRNSASLTMKHFLDALSRSEDTDLHMVFTRVVFPGLKRHLRTKPDIVRSEVLGVLACAVDRCRKVTAVQDMRILLADGDEEASFFNNVYHIQVHRRIRALHRLSGFCNSPGFKSSTMQDILIPIMNGFISRAESIDHILLNEAIQTLGVICKYLPWPAYCRITEHYIHLATEKSASERVFTRALVSVLDSFHFSTEGTVVDEGEALEEDGEESERQRSAVIKIHDAVVNRLLPVLLKHLEQRDEMEVSNRIPIAAGIGRICLHLPESSREIHISKLLTVLSQIFRSKSQDTRDLACETLCRLTVLLGVTYLPLVVHLLREALTRGPQLHVLAYVVHAVLVHVTSPENVEHYNNLDECVFDVADVSAEVIFGQLGIDQENGEYKSKMKEVRGSSSRGMDTFAILAKNITPSVASKLFSPIKAIMQETIAAKTMHSVDEVLRRMSTSITSNPHFGPMEILAFCHTMISQSAQFFCLPVLEQKRKGKVINDVTVQLKRRIDVDVDHYPHNSWRFVCFGLDLFSRAYRRGCFDLQDKDILSRLEPMVNLVGNTLYESNGNVILSGLKAATQITKCPVPNIDTSLPVFVRQILMIIRQTGTTEADVTQTAFKTLSAIIRDCRTAQIKEKDLMHLVELLTPDLDEADRQATAFTLLRAILSRKFVVPEIYDLMGRVGEIMVTSQSAQVQELCRSSLLQFMLDYPQGRARLKQHFAFLVKNLSYTYESGRLSIMAFLNAVLQKFSDAIIVEYADTIFVALVLVVANDDSKKCREIGAKLIKTLLDRLALEQQKSIMSLIHAWAAQDRNPALARVSSQMYGLALESLKLESRPYLPSILGDIRKKLEDSDIGLENEDKGMVEDVDWQTPYQALVTLSKVFQVFPDLASDRNRIPWSSVPPLLLFPHSWVRLASCRLLDCLFLSVSVNEPKVDTSDDTLLSLTRMKDIAKALSAQLGSENLDDTLSRLVVKNLAFIGKCFYVLLQRSSEDTDAVDEEDQCDLESEMDHVDGLAGTNPLPWLFSRLSYRARSAYITLQNKRETQDVSVLQISAVFRWFSAMASHMNDSSVIRFLPHILSPLYRVSEDTIVRGPQMDELKILAAELQDIVQKKAGTTKFANVYNTIRQKVMSVRHERRVARTVQFTTNPLAAAKRKLQKNLSKKESRKRKHRELVEQKGHMKVSKRKISTT